VLRYITETECLGFIKREYEALKCSNELSVEYMKEENIKLTNLKIQMYLDIFLNEVLEHTLGN